MVSTQHRGKDIVIGVSEQRRFWDKVSIPSGDDCWDWFGTKNESGYGNLIIGGRGGKMMKSHRLSWLINRGDIGEGLCVLHKCDNPACVNPKHLFLGTKKDNTRDMIAKGRNSPPPHSYGENHHHAKFDKSVALSIRNDSRPASALSKIYGVCEETIYRIKNRKTWATT